MRKCILLFFLFNINLFSAISVYAEEEDAFSDFNSEIDNSAIDNLATQGENSNSKQNENQNDNQFEAQDIVNENQNVILESENDFIDEANKSSNSSDTITLESYNDISDTYKGRRTRHGILFSIYSEDYYPLDYYSMFRDGYIEKTIGEDKIKLLGAELGYKYNFKLGSMAFLVGYSQGTMNSGDSATNRTLSLKRTSIGINYALDNYFQEPWVVPYAEVGVYQFQAEESQNTSSTVYEKLDVTTEMAFRYKFGLLVQLNWIENSIDPNTHSEGLRSSGLQNTFLDIYMLEHYPSTALYDPNDENSEGDPNLSSGLEYGLGLKMEF